MQKNFFIILLLLCLAGVGYITLNNGKNSSGLVGFTSLTKEDPLLYSAFFDTEGFAKRLADLKTSQQELMDIAIQNIRTNSERKDVYLPVMQGMYLFPLPFLGMLTSIHDATDTFLASSTQEHADSLLTLYAQAAEAYRTSIDANIQKLDTLKATLPKDLSTVYFFVDSATSLDVVYNDFVTIQKNATALQNEIIERKKCLAGERSCTSLARRGDITGILTQLDAKPDVPRERADFIQTTFTHAAQLQAARGPYKVYSRCWQSADSEHWMYLLRYADEPDLFPVMPKLATQSYYSKISNTPTDIINKTLREQGLDYYSQLEGSTYQCTDLTEYPTLLTLDFITEQIEQGSTTRAEVQTSPQYVSLMLNQFGLLPAALGALVANTDLLTDSQRASNYFIASPQFLLATRSAYSLLYLPFAHSVWRIDDTLQYLLPEDTSLREALTSRVATIDDLLNMGYTEAGIQAFHVNQRDFVKSLIKKSI